jgi:hypothetical protein
MSNNQSFFSFACNDCDYEVVCKNGNQLKLKKKLHAKVCSKAGREKTIECHRDSRNMRFNSMVGFKGLTWTPYDPADPTQERPEWRVPIQGGSLQTNSQLMDTQNALNFVLAEAMDIPLEYLPDSDLLS